MATLRTIFHRSFYTAAALSTLLLLATLILWPVTYRRIAGIYVVAPGAFGCEIDGLSGRAIIDLISAPPSKMPSPGISFHAPEAPLQEWSYWHHPKDYPGNCFAGIMVVHSAPTGGIDMIILTIPYSCLTILFSILPLLALRSLRRRRKSARIGLCPHCSYDLRAHAPGTTCPECGTPIPANFTQPKNILP